MKKSLPVIAVLTFALAFSGCALLGLEEDEKDTTPATYAPEGKVWSITSMHSTLDDVTDTFPVEMIAMDVDDDGTDETMTMGMFSYLSGGTADNYQEFTLDDGGTVTTTAAAAFAGMGMNAGLFQGSSAAYTITASTITMDGDLMNYTISGDTLTATGTMVDVDDDDNDGNVTETYIETMVLTAVTSPTLAQLTAAPDLPAE